MVTEYGMSERLGPVQYEGGGQVFLGRDYGSAKGYSEQIAYEIDQEVLRILNDGHDEAVRIIEENATKLKLIAEHLLEYETLNELEIKSLYEDGVLPTKDSDTDEYPREDDSEDDQTGTSYEEIKKAHEERVRAIEEQHQEQKEGRRTIGIDGSDPVDEEDETKVEKDPEDVDPKELESEAKSDDSEETTDDADGHDEENKDSK